MRTHVSLVVVGYCNVTRKVATLFYYEFVISDVERRLSNINIIWKASAIANSNRSRVSCINTNRSHNLATSGRLRRVTPVCRCIHPFCGWSHLATSWESKTHFGLPWVRPWDNRGKYHIDENRIQCLSNASQHVGAYPSIFNRFPVIQSVSSKVRHFSTFLHILAFPVNAPGTIAVNVTLMERGFNAGQMPRCIYPSIFNHFWDIAIYRRRVVKWMSVFKTTFCFPWVRPWDNRDKMSHGWKEDSMLVKRLAAYTYRPIYNNNNNNNNQRQCLWCCHRESAYIWLRHDLHPPSPFNYYSARELILILNLQPFLRYSKLLVENCDIFIPHLCLASEFREDLVYTQN